MISRKLVDLGNKVRSLSWRPGQAREIGEFIVTREEYCTAQKLWIVQRPGHETVEHVIYDENDG